MAIQPKPHSTTVRDLLSARQLRVPHPTAVLLAMSLVSAGVVAQRTVSWQVGAGGPVTTVVDQSPADANPIPNVISTTFAFATAWLTITGTVNGSPIAGINGFVVALTDCTITSPPGSPGVTEILTISHSFANAPLGPPVYAGAILNGKYLKVIIPAGTPPIIFENIDMECHPNGDPGAAAIAHGRPYSGLPIAFWDFDMRRTNYQSVTSVTGVVPFTLGGDGDQIFLPGSAEATVEPQDGYDTDFENFYCTSSGWPMAGQDGFYVPAVAGSIDSNCYSYQGNVLGVPMNPNGGSNFVAGRSLGGTSFARSQRTIAVPSGRGLRVDFDVCCKYLGTVAPTNNIGSLSFQPGATTLTPNLLARWPVNATLPPSVWDADFVLGPTAAGTQTTVPDPNFQGLAVNVWHRWGCTIDLGTRQYTEFRITNGSTYQTHVFYPPPGTMPLPNAAGTRPTDFRLFTGGGADNVFAVDNLSILYTADFATYEPYGQGCSGSLGVPTLAKAPGSRPALGFPFQANIGNLPWSAAVVATGFSDTMSAAGPLPMSLSVLGMTGCSLFADPLVLDFVVGTLNQATWNLNVPNNTSLIGATFFNQAFAFDPPANAFGFTTSNAARGEIGR